jgi:hypothetical protein
MFVVRALPYSLLIEGQIPRPALKPGFPGKHVFKLLPAGTAAATATAAPATTPASTAATASRTTTTASAAAMSGPAGWLRTSFVYVDGPAVQFCSIQLRNGGFGIPAFRHFHKRKAAWLTRVPVRHNIDALYRAIG